MGGGVAAAGAVGQCCEAAFAVCLLNREPDIGITEHEYSYLLLFPLFESCSQSFQPGCSLFGAGRFLGM